MFQFWTVQKSTNHAWKYHLITSTHLAASPFPFRSFPPLRTCTSSSGLWAISLANLLQRVVCWQGKHVEMAPQTSYCDSIYLAEAIRVYQGLVNKCNHNHILTIRSNYMGTISWSTVNPLNIKNPSTHPTTTGSQDPRPASFHPTQHENWWKTCPPCRCCSLPGARFTHPKGKNPEVDSFSLKVNYWAGGQPKMNPMLLRSHVLDRKEQIPEKTYHGKFQRTKWFLDVF